MIFLIKVQSATPIYHIILNTFAVEIAASAVRRVIYSPKTVKYYQKKVVYTKKSSHLELKDSHLQFIDSHVASHN